MTASDVHNPQHNSSFVKKLLTPALGTTTHNNSADVIQYTIVMKILSLIISIQLCYYEHYNNSFLVCP